MPGVSSQGATFLFNGTSMLATSVRVDYGRERPFISAPHMGLAAGDVAPSYEVNRTREDLPTVDVEFIGEHSLAVNQSGSLSITGPVSFQGTAATCTSLQINASVGDLVRGSATFRVGV